jgi:hypothetical protein
MRQRSAGAEPRKYGLTGPKRRTALPLVHPTKAGYGIPFTRHFHVYPPPRPLDVIRGEIEALEQEIQGMLGRVLG